MTDRASLSASLWRIVEENVGELMATGVISPSPPRTFAGHLVMDDAIADLLYLCSLVVSGRAQELGEVDLRESAEQLILRLAPERVEGFFSYRVAEAVLMLGGLDALGPGARRQALSAGHSARLIAEIASGLSSRRTNFVIVAARCIHAEARLTGREVDGPARSVLDRAAEIFARATSGWLDDGYDNEVHFDIYTPEMYLLAEPLHRPLEPTWSAGLRRVLGDLQSLTGGNGAVTWGRSIGPLALAMTLELAALAQEWADAATRSWWLAAAAEAAAELEGWFEGGVAIADRRAATDSYRGDARRLQLTFDLLGKVAWSAARLAESPHGDASWSGRRLEDLDLLVPFGRCAAAWSLRTGGISFVLPMMSGDSVDYLPSPRRPGLFEQPIDGVPLLVPTVTVGDRQRTSVHHVPGGLPIEVHHQDGRLDLAHDRWTATDSSAASHIAGSRRASYSISGRRMTVREEVTITEAPADATLTLTVGETEARPLTARCYGADSALAIKTSGDPELRTHWGEIRELNQWTVPFRRGEKCEFTWSVEPHVVVASTDLDHPYSQSLYASMENVKLRPVGPPDDDLPRRLRDVDILHLAWPERWVGVDLEATVRTIERIAESGTKVVWTQHNLRPHKVQTPEATETYEQWAKAADGVIHHSVYGREVARRSLSYVGAHHFVIPHGHWGSRFPSVRPPRKAVEAEEGWPSAPIRLAIVGQPRREKTLQEVVDAVHDSDRDDLQLVARLSPQVHVPSDPRVLPSYGHLDADRYYRRLTAVDAIILPFVGDTMVTTGTVFDCIGGGIAAIATPWGFLSETLGDCAITYDGSVSDLSSCLRSVAVGTLASAGSAARSLQPAHDWSVAASLTAAAFETVLSSPAS